MFVNSVCCGECKFLDSACRLREEENTKNAHQDVEIDEAFLGLDDIMIG